MRQRIALLCIAILFIAAFAIAYDHDEMAVAGDDCAICFASKISVATAGSVPFICNVQIAYSVPSEGPIVLPAAAALFAGTRAPPV